MPKNKVSDPITDQEIAFARLILSGAMTDRRAAESVGLNPDSAAYTKAKPRVRAYMLEHRAAVQQQLVQQEVDGPRRFSLDREQVLARLWQLANLGPEMTRGSITGQVKVLSMIIAMENFIPGRRAATAEKKSDPTPTPHIYKSAWLREQQATTIDPPSRPEGPVPACRGSVVEGPAVSPSPSQSTPANLITPPEAPPPAPYVPAYTFVPDLKIPFSIKKNPFARPR